MKGKPFVVIALITVVVFVIGFALAVKKPSEPGPFDGMAATIYLSPTCGCCGNYVAYMKGEGFDVETIYNSDTASVKSKFGIPSNLQACHTTVIGDYIAEGHIPVEGIEKMLDEKPSIRGIALPGMPAASPGMPGSKDFPFDVYELDDSVSPRIFVTI